VSDKRAEFIYNKFRTVEKQVRNIREMYEDVNGLTLGKMTAQNLGFHEAAQELLEFVKDFLDEIDLSDENMDPEKTKLKGVDELFKGHPATINVHNNIEIITKDGTDVKELAQTIQKKIFEAGSDGVYLGPPRNADKVLDDSPEQLDEGSCDEELCKWPHCPYEAENLDSIHDFVADVDAVVTDEINTAMDEIDEALKGVTSFTPADLKLVRFYLSHLPDYSKFEVDAMENHQVAFEYITRRAQQ